jgi:hypothetical protein
VSLLPDPVRREAFAEASRFRGRLLYESLIARRDDLFELVDAVLCADGAMKSPVDLTLLPEHPRGYGAMYGGLDQGRVDVGRLRTMLAGLSLPHFGGGRLVLAVDVPPWLRSDAACSSDRLFCHVYGRVKTASQFIPGWRYSFVAVLEPGATSWTAILDAVRLGPVDDATAVTDTSNYGKAETQAWDQVHPRLTHRSFWLDHEDELPLVEGTLIRLKVEHLSKDRDAPPVWS